MKNLTTMYPGKVVTTDDGFPFGKPKNVSASGAKDGTPWEEQFVQDLTGAQQAILSAAGMVPNGIAEQVGSSQVLAALQSLFTDPTELAAAILADNVTRDASDLCGAFAGGAAFPLYTAGSAVVDLAVANAPASYVSASAVNPRLYEMQFVSGTGTYLRETNATGMGAATTLSTVGTTITAVTTCQICAATLGTDAAPLPIALFLGSVSGTTGIYSLLSGANAPVLVKSGATMLLGTGYLGATLGVYVLFADASYIYCYTSANGTAWTAQGSVAVGTLAGPIYNGLTSTSIIQGDVGGASASSNWCYHLAKMPGATVVQLAVNAAGAPSTVRNWATGLSAITYADVCSAYTEQGFAVVGDGSSIYSIANWRAGTGTVLTPSIPHIGLFCAKIAGRQLVFACNAYSRAWDVYIMDASSGALTLFCRGLVSGGTTRRRTPWNGKRSGLVTSLIPRGGAAGSDGFKWNIGSSLNHSNLHG